MLSYLDLVSGGPQSLGIKLDIFAASAIYFVIGTLATIILFNTNVWYYSVNYVWNR